MLFLFLQDESGKIIDGSLHDCKVLDNRWKIANMRSSSIWGLTVISISPRFMPVIAVFLVSGIVLYLGLFDSGIATFVFVVAGWVISLCVHEFAHAFAAYHGGDRSVVDRGYLSFDPLRYVDPITSIAIPVAILAIGGIGLPGGAVYINQFSLNRHWSSIVSAAGPIGTAIVLAMLIVPLWVLSGEPGGESMFWNAWSFLAFLQVTALLFNLLPIPGLDGYGIIEPYLPLNLVRALAPYRQIAIFLLFGAFMFIPGVSAAFFSATYGVCSFLGLDQYEVIKGLMEFRFWM